MKIVIEIDELVYEGCLILNRANEGTIVEKAVANGTPLPEHHGRLIDADKLQRVDHIVLESTIDNAPTIIEGSDSE